MYGIVIEDFITLHDLLVSPSTCMLFYYPLKSMCFFFSKKDTLLVHSINMPTGMQVFIGELISGTQDRCAQMQEISGTTKEEVKN